MGQSPSDSVTLYKLAYAWTPDVVNGVHFAGCWERWKPGVHCERARSGQCDYGDDLSKVWHCFSEWVCGLAASRLWSVSKPHVSLGLKGVCDLASRLWGMVVATPCSLRPSCRSVLFCKFSHPSNFCPQPADFFHLQGEVQGRSLVTFATKLQMVEALRDPVVQRKYPNLAISKNSIFEKWALIWGTMDTWKWTWSVSELLISGEFALISCGQGIVVHLCTIIMPILWWKRI